jgi:tetratricopeptide (TPR) repeat protein
VPFQWDENLYIKDNPIVRDPGSFLEHSDTKEPRFFNAVNKRLLGYLTFALNYRLHGFDVAGYHVFNLAVHVLNGLLVYFLVKYSFMAPFLVNSSSRGYSKHIALFTGLVFVSHPVQTEAVTYIFQRFVSLVTFFYLFSLLMYVRWRLLVDSEGFINLRSLIFYTLSFIAAFLAMKIKENAFTLPIAIVLFEFFFFRGAAVYKDPLNFFIGITGVKYPIKMKMIRVIRLYPVLLALLVIPLTLTGMGGSPLEISSPRSPSMMGLEDVSRTEYFLTQYRVFVTYMRLLLFPVGQNLCHDYPVYGSFIAPQVLVSFLLFSSLFCLAVYLVCRSRAGKPILRLAAFGILWFFLTLSVESTVVPLPMVINEYRLYLPSVGAIMAIVSSVFFLADRLEGKRRRAKIVAASILALLTIALQATTYARNNVWRSSISLWEDVVSKSPLEPRGHNNLAIAYRSEGLTDKAIEHFRAALLLQPENAGLHNNIAFAYWSKGLTYEAISHYRKALELRPGLTDAHIKIGIIYCEDGRPDEAIEHFKKALALNPYSENAHNNIGIAYLLKGLSDKAIEHFRAALRLLPEHDRAHYNLGYAYFKRGLMEKAHRELDIALRLNPGLHKARRLHDSIHLSE